MGKKKQKQKGQAKTESVKAENVATIEDERISKIIVNALTEYDKQKQEKAKFENEAKLKADEKRLGINGNKGKFRAVLKILFRPKKYAKNMNAGAGLVRVALYAFYKLVELLVGLCAILFIAVIPLQYCIPSVVPMKWYLSVVSGVWGMTLLLLSRMFRIAAIEVDEVKDNNYLFGLFTAVTSIVSAIISIIALVK